MNSKHSVIYCKLCQWCEPGQQCKPCQHYEPCQQCKQLIARCYLHLGWYFFLQNIGVTLYARYHLGKNVLFDALRVNIPCWIFIDTLLKFPFQVDDCLSTCGWGLILHWEVAWREITFFHLPALKPSHPTPSHPSIQTPPAISRTWHNCSCSCPVATYSLLMPMIDMICEGDSAKPATTGFGSFQEIIVWGNFTSQKRSQCRVLNKCKAYEKGINDLKNRDISSCERSNWKLKKHRNCLIYSILRLQFWKQLFICIIVLFSSCVASPQGRADPRMILASVVS